MGFIAIALAVAVAWMAHAGVFYQTGTQWFQSCWIAKHEKRSPVNPDESIAWAKCEPTTRRVVFSAGFVPSGNPEYAVVPELKAIGNACPSNYSDIPIFGMNYLAVDIIEKSGGPTVLDSFIPPDAMIKTAFTSKWPHCQSVAKANGFPKAVQRGEAWEFESPCIPCEAEKKAIEASQRSK